MHKLDRQRLVFGLYLLVLVAAGEVLAGHLHVPAWPAFIAMIFFFVEHMNVKKAPAIVAGGMFGIVCIFLAKPIISTLAPVLGVELATLGFVLIVVYAIVAFGELLPWLFNNYAFMYLTVTGVAVRLPNPNPFLWIAITALGGSALIAGVIGIDKWMRRKHAIASLA